jgi:hypothetical protein
MARKLYYKINDDGETRLTDEEWVKIARLQHWYNSEFIWTAGKLALKMYVVFLNTDQQNMSQGELEYMVQRRREEYVRLGFTENEIILHLEKENLIVAKRGGYFDDCLASGFTRVAGNEFNAFLVCDFLLKISLICPRAVISVHDEGEFIKTKHVNVQGGEIHIPLAKPSKIPHYQNMIEHRHVFSIVDAAKYDHYPRYVSTIPNFNDMTPAERKNILKEWNWLGFESNYDINGDDIQGYNLNQKVKAFVLEGAS